MITFFKSTPFRRALTWSAASIANTEHFKELVHKISVTPLPKSLSDLLSHLTAATWGQLGHYASLALAYGALQLAWIMVTHLSGAVTVGWWAFESVKLYREFREWLRKTRTWVKEKLHRALAALRSN